MADTSFEDLFHSLEKGVASIAQDSLKDYLNEAKKDGQQAINDLKENLQRWTEEVENGAIGKEDLQFLLQGEAALDELISLKEAGLAAVRVDQFRNSLINMITSTVFGFIKV